MARDTEVDTLIINELKKEQYTSAEISDTELYYVTDEKIAIEDIDNLQEELDAKQAKLVAGPNITINPDTNEISATGGGEPIDAYTKAETDGLLANKQDVLTPNDPLKIETYRKSNMVGMVYNDDGTGVYEPNHKQTSSYMTSANDGNIVSNRLELLYNHDPSTGSNMFTFNASATFTNPVEVKPSDWLGGYIEIPYTLGDIVETPLGGSSGTSGLFPIYGKLLADGSFIPISDFRYFGDNVYINTGDKIYEGKSTASGSTAHYIISDTGAYAKIPTGTTVTPSVPSFLLETSEVRRLTVENNVLTYENMTGNTGRTPRVLTVSVTQAIANRLKEINAVRIIAGYGFATAASNAIKVERLKAYHSDKPIAEYTSLEELEAHSYYEVTGETVKNYLDLKTDSSLIITEEGNLSVNTDAMAFGSELDYDGTNLSLLSSDGSTLSSVEISLEDKQDRLTPLAPLQIQDKLISPIENYTVTDTTIIPNKYNTEGDVPLIVQNGKVGLDLSNAHITVPFVPNGLWSGAGRPFYGFFDGDRFVPVATVKYIMPTNTFSSTSYASIIFINAENATSLSEVGYAYMGSRVVSDGTGWSSFVLNNTTGFSFTQGTYGTRATTVGSTLASNFPRNATAHQIDVNTSNKLVLQEWYNNTNGYYLYNVYVGLDAGARALWDKVTHVVTMAFAASAINKADIRYYTESSAKCALTLAGLNEYSLARPNSIDLENAQTQHQMSVNVDNTTVKVNADGNLEAQYPAELNGVKLFPITQAGYDELAEKDPNTLYVVTDGAETMLADASNITAAGEAALCSLSFSSERFTDFTLGASGTSYTAPADGFFALVKTGATSMQYIELTAGGLTVRGFVPWNGGTAAAYIQVNKGSSLTVYYNASGATNSFRFYYAKGAQ